MNLTFEGEVNRQLSECVRRSVFLAIAHAVTCILRLDTARSKRVESPWQHPHQRHHFCWRSGVMAARVAASDDVVSISTSYRLAGITT